MWPLRVKDANSNLLRLLLLLIMKLRNVLTTVWCRFVSWSLVTKLNVCSDRLTDRVQSLVKILKLRLKVGRDFEAVVCSDSHFLGIICNTWLEWCSWRGRGSWWRQQKRNRLLEGGTLQDTSGPAGGLHFWIEIVILSNISTWPTWYQAGTYQSYRYQSCRSAQD